jgi:hypothetical protein
MYIVNVFHCSCGAELWVEGLPDAGYVTYFNVVAVTHSRSVLSLQYRCAVLPSGNNANNLSDNFLPFVEC